MRADYSIDELDDEWTGVSWLRQPLDCGPVPWLDKAAASARASRVVVLGSSGTAFVAPMDTVMIGNSLSC